MVKIKKTSHTDGTRAIYKGAEIIGTISCERPTRCNNRADTWSIAWTTGRVDWFGTFSEARNDALKA